MVEGSATVGAVPAPGPTSAAACGGRQGPSGPWAISLAPHTTPRTHKGPRWAQAWESWDSPQHRPCPGWSALPGLPTAPAIQVGDGAVPPLLVPPVPPRIAWFRGRKADSRGAGQRQDSVALSLAKKAQPSLLKQAMGGEGQELVAAPFPTQAWVTSQESPGWRC